MDQELKSMLSLLLGKVDVLNDKFDGLNGRVDGLEATGLMALQRQG